MALPMNGVIRTMCPMNCYPTLCGMRVEMRAGKVARITGDKDNPDSRGFLCIRGQAAGEIIGNPERLVYPLIRERRVVDRFRRASWDEALDLIAARVRHAGRETFALWAGHGSLANNFGIFFNGQLMQRFANLYGSQYWNGTMICWGLGGFGLGITGVLESNTKEDLGANAGLVLLWGANIASQPNTARHIVAARKRGARIVTIDVRHSEAGAQSDETILIKPGTDAALALALMHVIISENRHDRDFIAAHTEGFEQLEEHVRPFTPQWAAGVTGVDAAMIVELARLYASVKPAMIVMGGSSMHKGANTWMAARAISCLPALTGNLGIAGGGLGPRHASDSHGYGLAKITAEERRKPGSYIPDQLADISAGMNDGRIRVMMLMGSNILSSFADTGQVEAGLERTDLVVSHDLFMNETARRHADVVLPGTAWLEELGCKKTNTHLYLMEQALEPEGECRSMADTLKGLAERLDVPDFYPWQSQEGVIDGILDHPCAQGATVAAMRANDGRAPLDISHVAYPDFRFDTPSGKVEFYSRRAADNGLPPLPVHEHAGAAAYPLALTQGRTLSQFHSFYDQGQALPTLKARNKGPELWMSPGDARARGVDDGADITISNEQGSFAARAHVTGKIPDGVVWMRDGWVGLNRLTSGAAVLPQSALDMFSFTVGQFRYGAMVDVAAR